VRRPTRLGVGWLVAGLVLAIALALRRGPGAAGVGGSAHVLRVIDWDTIEVDLAGVRPTCSRSEQEPANSFCRAGGLSWMR
jgi:hypothetical protein